MILVKDKNKRVIFAPKKNAVFSMEDKDNKCCAPGGRLKMLSSKWKINY
jgi:hypothetical protein